MNQLLLDIVGDIMVNTLRRNTNPQLEWADTNLPDTSDARVVRAPYKFQNVHPTDAFTLPPEGPKWVRVNGIPYLKNFVGITILDTKTGVVKIARIISVPLDDTNGNFLNPGAVIPAGGKFQSFRQGAYFDLAALPNGVYSAWLEVDPLNEYQAYANTSKLWAIEAYQVKDHVPA